MLGRTDSRLRLVALLGVFAVIATLLGVRLAYWQLGQGLELRQIAASQMQRPQTEQEIRRGDITDRRGNILATTAYRDLLSAYPDQMTDEQRQQTVTGLATILGLDSQQQADLLAALGTAGNAAPYTVISRQLTETQSDQVRAALASGDLVQLGLEPHPVRVYPSAGGSPGTTLASQLLGFVTQDGQGRYGVEQASQDILAGAGSATADAERERATAADWRQRAAHDRREPSAAAGKGAARRVGRRPGLACHRTGDGSVHRRDPRVGQRARVRREQLRAWLRKTRRACSLTRSEARSTSPAR